MAEEQFLGEGMAAAAEEMPSKFLSPKTLAERPDVVESIRSVIRRTSPAGAAAANRGMARRPDMEEELPRIDVPTLVIVGEDDRISPPEEMALIASRIPGARFETIPEAGHLSPLENPAAFNATTAGFLA